MSNHASSGEMRDWLDFMENAKMYTKRIEHAEGIISQPPETLKDKLILNRDEAACLECKKRMGKIIVPQGRYCVKCWFEQHLLESEIERERAVRTKGRLLGKLTLANGEEIPFLWNHKVDYHKVFRYYKSEKSCLVVAGMVGQLKYIPTEIVVSLGVRGYGQKGEE
ncbi:hypothetical protein SAMN04487866_12219 [Thermoactinomyces sp. DSM 45891]|uniref:hypothetical protein n=1 Tax=Thermoactinomyces sp. DSM 45891 TaxID=1761907 RepID=UPI000911A2D0|nr:hypothetical protein [Thermoactinomyces sp. DSM 45891]SFX74828.1 hypothetical protein SAMN04487866_12219 [Thermoactinomyces sp. DSM 45891]